MEGKRLNVSRLKHNVSILLVWWCDNPTGLETEAFTQCFHRTLVQGAASMRALTISARRRHSCLCLHAWETCCVLLPLFHSRSSTWLRKASIGWNYFCPRYSRMVLWFRMCHRRLNSQSGEWQIEWTVPWRSMMSCGVTAQHRNSSQFCSCSAWAHLCCFFFIT